MTAAAAPSNALAESAGGRARVSSPHQCHSTFLSRSTNSLRHTGANALSRRPGLSCSARTGKGTHISRGQRSRGERSRRAVSIELLRHPLAPWLLSSLPIAHPLSPPAPDFCTHCLRAMSPISFVWVPGAVSDHLSPARRHVPGSSSAQSSCSLTLSSAPYSTLLPVARPGGLPRDRGDSQVGVRL